MREGSENIIKNAPTQKVAFFIKDQVINILRLHRHTSVYTDEHCD